MKTVGARDKGAESFLTPADNCAAAAKDTPNGLTLVKVDTIDDALGAEGHPLRTPPTCRSAPPRADPPAPHTAGGAPRGSGAPIAVTGPVTPRTSPPAPRPGPAPGRSP
ncbi:hypothetical protein SGLAM104S_03219 [Streptomyces glaucescens]